MKSRLWHHLACDDEPTAALAAALGVNPIIARLLCMRGLADPEQAQRFLVAFGPIRQHFCPYRHLLAASAYRHLLASRFDTWRRIAASAA